MFNLIGNWRTAFQRDCTVLHSHQQCNRSSSSSSAVPVFAVASLCHFSHFLLDMTSAFLMSSVGDSCTHSSPALETWVMENGFKTRQLQVPQTSVPKSNWSTESEAAFVKHRLQALLQTSGISISRIIFWETTFSKNCLGDPFPCYGWEPIPSHFQTQCCLWYAPHRGFPGGSDGKESACNVGDLGLIPGFDSWVGRSPGEGNGNPLQYPGLENPHEQRSLVGYSQWGHKG